MPTPEPMAQSPLSIPIFPFWQWLTFGRLLLAGCWIVCVSIAFGRFVKSATEFDTPNRPPPKLVGNPFGKPTPSFSPEELAARRERWHRVSQIPEPTHSNLKNQAEMVEHWKAERQEAESLSIPGNFPERGNYGHMEVDFGAQWMLGRMMVRGYGQELYNRNRQRQVLNESFLIENEHLDHQLYRFPSEMRPSRVAAENLKSDAEMLMDWTVGGGNDSARWPELGKGLAIAFSGGTGANPFAHTLAQAHSIDFMSPDPRNIAAAFACGLDNNPFVAVRMIDAAREALTPLDVALSRPSCGGPLYPPVHALLYSPLAMIEDPRVAYYVFQLVSSLSIFVSAYSVRVISNGRIWTPVAGGLLLLYPGYQPGLTLGQNHIISLAIVMAGWALACRGRLYLGGIVWGFLAFKPVWAVVFGLVPLLMWRPRFLVGMATSGLALCAATLPFVGIHGWKNWLANGGEATVVYNRNSNWINLSRDLSGIVRRLMLDLSDKTHEFDRNVPIQGLPKWAPQWSAADFVSWALLFLVFAATVVVYRVWGRPRKLVGLSAGFLFLGCYLCCFRFMYYDALLSSVGVAALFAYPMWYIPLNAEVRPGRLAVLVWYPLVMFVVLLIPGLLLLIADASTACSFAGFDTDVITLSGEMKYEGFLVWAVVLNVLLVAAYWLVFRVGSRSDEDGNPPAATSRNVVAKWNSLPMTLLGLLLLLHTYFLQAHPEATVKLFHRSDRPRVFTVAMNYDYANDTFLLLGLWMWAGWKMIRGGPRPEEEST